MLVDCHLHHHLLPIHPSTIPFTTYDIRRTSCRREAPGVPREGFIDAPVPQSLVAAVR